MAAISLTYDIVANTEVQALPLQTNFQELENYINGSVIRADGVVGMDPGTQLLLAGDATSALAAATKQQVDAKISKTGGTFTGQVVFDVNAQMDGIAARDNQGLRLMAGESDGQVVVDDVNGEAVYLIGEAGVRAVSSPDNWGSGWAGRNTAILLSAAGDTEFPGTVKAADPTAGTHLTTRSYVDAKTWNGNDITAGTVAFARLPTGTSSSTVAIGNHNHSGVYANSSHNHSGSNITSGTVSISRLPTGTGSSNVALGNHNHSGVYATSGHTHGNYVETTGTESISGIKTFTSNLVTAADLTIKGSHSYTSCPIHFFNDTNTGITSDGGNSIQLVAGGAPNLGVTLSAIFAPPAYSSTTSGVGGTFYDVQINSGGRLACVFSSERLKENVTPITTEEAYKVLELEPVTYNGIGSDITEVGRIAEQAAEITPLLVKWDDELGIPNSYDYSREVVLLTEVVKDLRARIEQLEAV